MAEISVPESMKEFAEYIASQFKIINDNQQAVEKDIKYLKDRVYALDKRVGSYIPKNRIT